MPHQNGWCFIPFSWILLELQRTRGQIEITENHPRKSPCGGCHTHFCYQTERQKNPGRSEKCKIWESNVANRVFVFDMKVYCVHSVFRHSIYSCHQHRDNCGWWSGASWDPPIQGTYLKHSPQNMLQLELMFFGVEYYGSAVSAADPEKLSCLGLGSLGLSRSTTAAILD